MARGARPPMDQSRRAVSVGRRPRLARPPTDPEQNIARWFSSGTDSVSPDLNTEKLLKIPRPRPPTFQRLRRLTCKAGSNSRLRMTERGMTEDEHNRGHGPSPSGGRRIFASRIRDPCECHASGIPSREAPSPRNLANGFNIHRDYPRVF